jgi:hypothetical protein
LSTTDSGSRGVLALGVNAGVKPASDSASVSDAGTRGRSCQSTGSPARCRFSSSPSAPSKCRVSSSASPRGPSPMPDTSTKDA